MATTRFLTLDQVIGHVVHSQKLHVTSQLKVQLVVQFVQNAQKSVKATKITILGTKQVVRDQAKHDIFQVLLFQPNVGLSLLLLVLLEGHINLQTHITPNSSWY